MLDPWTPTPVPVVAPSNALLSAVPFGDRGGRGRGVVLALDDVVGVGGGHAERQGRGGGKGGGGRGGTRQECAATAGGGGVISHVGAGPPCPWPGPAGRDPRWRQHGSPRLSHISRPPQVRPGSTDGLSLVRAAARTVASWPRHPRRRSAPAMEPAPSMADEPRPDPAAQPEPPVLLDRSAALLRIAAVVSGQQDLARLFEDVIDESFSLFGVDQAGLWMYHDGPQPLSLAAQRGLSPEILALVATLPRDATTSGMTAIREQRVQVMDGDLSLDAAGPARDLPAGRHPDDLLRADRVRRRAARPAGAVPPSRVRLDAGRDGPGPRLRRPHGDRHRQRPAGRIHADAGRPAALHLGPGPAPEPDPRRRRHRPGHRLRGARPHRSRHGPGLPGGPCRRHVRTDRVPGHVRRHGTTRTPPRSGSGSARA